MNDEYLVEACLEGDVRAFAALVDRYRYPVYGICLGYTRDFDAAEDAAQEALISAYAKLRDLPEPQHFGPWLRRIAVNQCRMWQRRQRRLLPLSEEQEKSLIDPGQTPEERVIARENQERGLVAIGQLSRPQQQAVVLFYLEDLSLRQIADFLDVSVQTIEQRLYRARLRLKEEILNMVSKTLKDRQLPESFTREVVDQALKRGREFMEERDWASARGQFSRITQVLPDHLDASRGLALAFNGEVREALREAQRFDDSQLLQDAFAALEKAYDLGADDREIVRAIAGLYSHFGRHREGGEFLEKAAEKQSDWKESVPLLGSAIAVYYHSHYTDRGDNMEACVRCHRRMRGLVPADWPARRRLTIWQPAGMTLAYAHLGLSQEVFDELDALKAEVEEEWAVQDYFQYTCACANQCREVGKWEGVEEYSREYVDWAKAIPPDNPRLFIPPVTLTGSRDHIEKEHVGEYFRWWSICFTLADRIAKPRHKDGRDTAEIFTELERALEQHEAHCRSVKLRAEENLDDEDLQAAAREEEKHLSGSYITAGEAAYETGRYEDALRYYQREEELSGALAVRGPIYLAASLTALGRADEARKRLRSVYGRVVTNGQCRAYFSKCREFDSIREDSDIVALVAEWESAEKVWNEETA